MRLHDNSLTALFAQLPTLVPGTPARSQLWAGVGMLRGPGSQHALKKLQVEVKGIQKQLPERLTEFDDTLAQAKQAAADGSRPVKLLDELRRMRKNLERDRKKLRTYSSVEHVRSDAAQRIWARLDGVLARGHG